LVIFYENSEVLEAQLDENRALALASNQAGAAVSASIDQEDYWRKRIKQETSHAMQPVYQSRKGT